VENLATWFGQAVHWITEAIFALGYPGIVLLMALESSFFPFPSEVVLPPAGYLAAQGRMNAWLALACGVGGSVLGALFNYFVAVRLGRPLLHRYGRYCSSRKRRWTGPSASSRPTERSACSWGG
jgi:membrane protein DedA with SNARE-associated domain